MSFAIGKVFFIKKTHCRLTIIWLYINSILFWTLFLTSNHYNFAVYLARSDMSMDVLIMIYNWALLCHTYPVIVPYLSSVDGKNYNLRCSNPRYLGIKPSAVTTGPGLYVFVFECLFRVRPLAFCSLFKIGHVMGAKIITSTQQTEKSFQLSRVSNPGPLNCELSALTIRPKR